MKKSIISIIYLSISLLVLTSQAQANTIYAFDAHGTALSNGRPNNGSAVFDFSSTLDTLSITLANTAGPSQLAGISSILDGVQFTLSNIPTTITLTGANAAGTVDVPKSGPVVFNDPLGGIPMTGSNPFGWTLQASSSGGWLLAAGDGSFKPYGIVNHNIENSGGLGNAEHNPYLDGPVKFSFALTGLNANTIPQVNSANLYFGTVPDVQKASPVPLPGALMLFGPGLAGLVFLRRRVTKS